MPARLVARESIFEVSEGKHEAALARDGLAAAERGGLVERRHSLWELAKAPQRQALTQERLGEARSRLACLKIGLKGLLDAIELQKGVAKIDCGFRKITTKLKRALSRFSRLLKAPKLAQRSRAAAPRVRIIRREPRRRCKRIERFRESAGARQELAGVDMRDHKRSVELKRAAIETHRRIRLAAFAQHVPAHTQSVGEIGPYTKTR